MTEVMWKRAVVLFWSVHRRGPRRLARLGLSRRGLLVVAPGRTELMVLGCGPC